MDIQTDVGRRISKVSEARGLFDQIRREYEQIGRARAKIAGLVDGNRPYNSVDLRREGLGWFPNINTREAENILREQAAGFWELEMEVPSLITLKIADAELMGANLPYNDWIGVIEDEYTRLVKGWFGYELNRIMGVREKLLFGLSAHYWEDDYDWRFKTLKASNIYVPSDAESDISRLDMFFVWHAYRLYEIMDLLEEPEGAGDAGWNVGALKKIVKDMLFKKLTPEERYRLSSFEAIQQEYKDNSFEASYVTLDSIPVVDLFVRERSDKWSRYRFSSEQLITDEDKKDFLMIQEDKWDDINKVINFDLYEVGDNTLRSVKGLGQKIYALMDSNNRLASNIMGGGMLSSGLLIKPMTAGAKNSLSITRRGPITILPENYDVLQQNLVPQIQGALGIRSMVTQILNNNSGIYKTTVAGSAQYRSKDEVGLEAMKNAQFERSDSAFAYIFRDFFHRELFRRIMIDIPEIPDIPEYKSLRSELKLFRERCKKKGVPEEYLKTELYDVYATRAIGFGSPISKDYTTRELMQIMPGFDEVGRRNVTIDRVASLVGYSMAGRYVGGQARMKIPVNDSSIAALENNDIRQGMMVEVGTDQLHEVHIGEHLKLMQDFQNIIDSGVQQLADTLPIQKSIQLFVNHVAEHIANIKVVAIQKQYNMMLQELMKAIGNITRMLMMWQTQLDKRNQEIAQTMSDKATQEMNAKLEEISKNAYVKMKDKEMQNQIRATKAEADIEMKRIRLENEIALKERETDAEIARKNKEQQQY
jgi:hypothetical protein